jgi:hypothetical protein
MLEQSPDKNFGQARTYVSLEDSSERRDGGRRGWWGEEGYPVGGGGGTGWGEEGGDGGRGGKGGEGGGGGGGCRILFGDRLRPAAMFDHGPRVNKYRSRVSPSETLLGTWPAC